MFECKCKSCVNACEAKPGWFKPEEIEPLAKNMGLTVQELFDQHLGVDWWQGDIGEVEDRVFLLAPATIKMEPGKEYPTHAMGQCRLLKDGLCTIHDKGKPFECAALNHDDGHENNHYDAAVAWAKKGAPGNDQKTFRP